MARSDTFKRIQRGKINQPADNQLTDKDDDKNLTQSSRRKSSTARRKRKLEEDSGGLSSGLVSDILSGGLDEGSGSDDEASNVGAEGAIDSDKVNDSSPQERLVEKEELVEHERLVKQEELVDQEQLVENEPLRKETLSEESPRKSSNAMISNDHHSPAVISNPLNNILGIGNQQVKKTKRTFTIKDSVLNELDNLLIDKSTGKKRPGVQGFLSKLVGNALIKEMVGLGLLGEEFLDELEDY